MIEELYEFIDLTRTLRLLHLPPLLKLRPPESAILEKAYLMQVRLDLEAKTSSTAETTEARNRGL